MSEPAIFDPHPSPVSAPVVITLFGNVQIQINGKAVDTLRLNKSRALLAYLLAEGAKPHLRTELAALLWPGYTDASARVSLRQVLADLRNLLAPFDLLHITNHQVALRAESTLLWCDVAQAQRLLANWQHHAQHKLSDCTECWTAVQQAVALIKGAFLADLPPTASPPFDAWLLAQQRHWAAEKAAAQSALATVPQRVGNLRPALTTLIGRTNELAELQKKVAHPTYRCLTLVGPGGIGKTRLALALGAASAATFPDGVWLVELSAPAAPPAPAIPAEETAEQAQDRLATAIGATLGIPFQGTAHPRVQIAAQLRDKALLLLLDNFETARAGAELLLQLLAAAPQLRLVVNSRQRLPLHAQVVHIVKGLATPPAADSAAEALAGYASVQLFLERAQNAGFTLPHDAVTLTTIGALCRLVHGSPWAIELAVAMLDHHTPAALLHAIGADYRALTGGWLDLPPRLRNAGAVLHTMWGLLTPHEATRLAHCAIFRGGFTPAAGQTISALSAADVEALVHKSLLHPVDAARFTLHELVRQFAAEQLAQRSADQQTVAARHAAYYMALLQTQEAALVNHTDAQTIIQSELDNLRAAWQWSVAQGELALLAQGANSLFTFYGLAGLYHEAIQQLESAIARLRPLLTATPPDAPRLRLLARLLNYGAEFYQRTGALATSARLATEALALGQAVADPALQAFAYHMLTHVTQARHDLPAMQTLAEAGCTQARLAQRGDLLSECLNKLGICTMLQQQLEAATAYFEEALETLAGATNRYLEAQILANLGQIRLLTKEYELARHYLQKSRLLHQTLRDRESRVSTHLMLGDLWTVLGIYGAAQEEYQQAQALLELTANPYWVSWLQICYGYWRHLCGDSATARASLTLGRQTAQQSGNGLFEALALLYLGYVLIDGGEWSTAQACFAQSLDLQAAAPWSVGTADAHAGLATCLLTQGQKTAAIAQVDTVFDLLAQHGVGVASELFLVYWLCFQVLQTVADARALDVLQTAYAQMQACAAPLEDPTLRHAFLNNVAVNRALVRAAQAAGLA